MGKTSKPRSGPAAPHKEAKEKFDKSYDAIFKKPKKGKKT